MTPRGHNMSTFSKHKSACTLKVIKCRSTLKNNDRLNCLNNKAVL